MSCSFDLLVSQPTPPQIPLLGSGALGTKSVNGLTQLLQDCPPEYREVFTPGTIATRSAFVALAILGVATYVLLLSGHFSTFPQDFMRWIHTINPVNAAIGMGVTIVLIAGASWVIHRARTKADKLLKGGRGTFEDVGSCLETVLATYTSKKGNAREVNFYIDKSTIKKIGAEKAYLYNIKSPGEHYSVSTIVTFLGAPICLVGTIVYNVIRTAIVPFYVLFQYVRDRYVGTPVVNPMVSGEFSKRLYVDERSFEILDIPKEMIRSISRILQAPFYALAVFMAGLYSLVNPMGGRKLGATIERDWNDEVSLAEGYWSVGGEQDLFNPEGGGGPNGLGRNGFYLAGCWQPVGIAEYQEGEFVKAYYLPKAINSMAGVDYTISTRSDLEQRI